MVFSTFLNRVCKISRAFYAKSQWGNCAEGDQLEGKSCVKRSNCHVLLCGSYYQNLDNHARSQLQH